MLRVISSCLAANCCTDAWTAARSRTTISRRWFNNSAELSAVAVDGGGSSAGLCDKMSVFGCSTSAVCGGGGCDTGCSGNTASTLCAPDSTRACLQLVREDGFSPVEGNGIPKSIFL